jgi:hypothetical protein
VRCVCGSFLNRACRCTLIWPVALATSKPSFSGQEIRLSRIVHNRCFEASANAKGTLRPRQTIPAAARGYIEYPVLWVGVSFVATTAKSSRLHGSPRVPQLCSIATALKLHAHHVATPLQASMAFVADFGPPARPLVCSGLHWYGLDAMSVWQNVHCKVLQRSTQFKRQSDIYTSLFFFNLKLAHSNSSNSLLYYILSSQQLIGAMPSITSTFSAIAALAIQLASAKDWDSPAYNYLYQYPLPIAPVKKPLK